MTVSIHSRKPDVSPAWLTGQTAGDHQTPSGAENFRRFQGLNGLKLRGGEHRAMGIMPMDFDLKYSADHALGHIFDRCATINLAVDCGKRHSITGLDPRIRSADAASDSSSAADGLTPWR